MKDRLLTYILLVLAGFASTGLLRAEETIKDITKPCDTIYLRDTIVKTKKIIKKDTIIKRDTLTIVDSVLFNVKVSLFCDTNGLSNNNITIAYGRDTCLTFIKSSEKEENKSIKNAVPQILSEWVFPLIIMLFAFGFPFLFNGINRIEDKYHSYSISSGISNSKKYKDYKRSLYVSIIAAIMYCFMFQIKQTKISDEGLFKTSAVFVVFIASIALVVTTIRLINEMFQYNDVYKLFNSRKSEISQNFTKSENNEWIVSLYDYAMCHNMSDLSQSIEDFLLEQIKVLREKNPNTNKFNNRYEIEYPKVLLENYKKLYESALVAGNASVAQRLVHLICKSLFDRVTKSGVLPGTILSQTTLSLLWDITKSTIHNNNDVAFSIIWKFISEYYKQLNPRSNTSPSAQLQLEKNKIQDLCFIIGAYNYKTYALENLRLMLIVDFDRNEDLYLTHIENILLLYYRCTGDFYSPRMSSFDAYERYKIIETNGATKKQQYEPLYKYASFLINRIYNKSVDLLQFDPITLSKTLFNEEQKSFAPTTNLFEALSNNKQFEFLADSELKLTALMSEDDAKSLWRNIVIQNEYQENIRLYQTPISRRWDDEFKKRFKIELQVHSNEILSLCTYQQNSEDNHNYSSTDTYTCSINPISLETKHLLDQSYSILCSKKFFVYASFIHSEDNQYAAAKNLANNICQGISKTMVSVLNQMREEKAAWPKDKQKLCGKLDELTLNKKNSIIIYFSLRNDGENAIDLLLKGEKYATYNKFGRKSYNEVPIYIINGKDIPDEYYASLRKTFMIIDKDYLPIFSFSTGKGKDEYYQILYEDKLINQEAMINITMMTDAKLRYHRHIAKLVKVNF